MSLPSQSQIQAWWRPRCTGPFVWVYLHGSGRVQVRASMWEAVAALNAVLVAWNYRTRSADTGGGNCRPKVSGSGWSNHAFWIAVDLNWQSNPYSRRLVTDMPAGMVRQICAIRTKNGKQVWNWGGYWSGNKDAMHFEVVCSPRDLASGVDVTVGSPSTKPSPSPSPFTTGSTSTPKPTGDPDMVRFLTSHSEYGSRLVVISDDQGYRESGVATAADANAFAQVVPSIQLSPKALQDLRAAHQATTANGRVR